MPENLIATTAIINISPESDLVVLQLVCEANKLRDYAIARTIGSDADVKPATEDLSLIAKVKKALAEKKAEYVKPVKAHLDAFNAAFTSVMAPLEDADRITRGKIMAYRQEQERKAREAEEINRLRMEAARKEMELKGELSEAVNLVEVPAEAPKRVDTEVGSLGTAKIWKFEIVDTALVPREYLAVDMVKIGQVVRATKGSISIPGVRVFSEDTLKITARG